MEVLKSETVAITHLAIEIDSQVTHHFVPMEKSKCNTFQVISDLVHDFMNFNALKLF